jgi:hypothetical protein
MIRIFSVIWDRGRACPCPTAGNRKGCPYILRRYDDSHVHARKEVRQVQPEEKNVQEPPKEEYAVPELIVHGSVEEITEAASSVAEDIPSKSDL